MAQAKQWKKFLEIEPEFSAYEGSKIVIVPVPFEKTVSYGKGTKNGPKAILEASQIVEDYDIELDCEPYKKTGICTLPPVTFSKEPHGDIYNTAKKLFADQKFPIFLGGEHSISYGPVKAAKERFHDLSVLQFDAHADLRDSYHGSKHSHASIMRRVREMCPAVQVGIRSQDREERDYLAGNGMTGEVFYAHEMDHSKISSIVNMLSNNVYLTFDVDGLDPSIVPATGTPEPGGLSWELTLAIIKKVSEERRIIGADFVELSPKPGFEYADYTIAKLIYKTIGYVSRKL